MNRYIVLYKIIVCVFNPFARYNSLCFPAAVPRFYVIDTRASFSSTAFTHHSATGYVVVHRRDDYIIVYNRQVLVFLPRDI